MKPLTNRFLDFIYPATCHLCQRSLTQGRHLCDPCTDTLHLITPPFCSQCGESYDGKIHADFICPNCHDLDFSFDFAKAALHSDGEGRALVHDFKYRRQIHLARELGRLAAIALDDPRFHPYLNDGILIPVPLYRLRLRKRKFNQSEEIAKCLAKNRQLTAVNALKRNRNTQTQTRFSRAKRLANLSGAFDITPRFKARIQDKRVILLDDVFTTGSTANECAQVLVKNGASHVAVLTVLRG
ncbi:MAG: ComF family protein [Verrucomicrobiae bacterium]|nr:ComF family protein [Verrucomicrobiae bacterium]NNJ43970.1 ComF family protein [Akkermansiaceae bacterium]